jgi:RNA polymerase sigma-70 factor (ECF subfamily)
VIKTASCGIAQGSPLVIADVLPACSSSETGAERADRAENLASHLDFLWRFACRMGVGAAAAEDIAHEAFVIALSRIDTITPGKERSFLLSVVVNMTRRERQRGARHEELVDEPEAPPADAPDRVLDDKRARALLDRSLDALDDSLRAVFVLHEIEEETMADIAELLDLAPGTVASRLRRAREEWKRATERLKREGVRA